MFGVEEIEDITGEVGFGVVIADTGRGIEQRHEFAFVLADGGDDGVVRAEASGWLRRTRHSPVFQQYAVFLRLHLRHRSRTLQTHDASDTGSRRFRIVRVSCNVLSPEAISPVHGRNLVRGLALAWLCGVFPVVPRFCGTLP